MDPADPRRLYMGEAKDASCAQAGKEGVACGEQAGDGHVVDPSDYTAFARAKKATACCALRGGRDGARGAVAPADTEPPARYRIWTIISAGGRSGKGNRGLPCPPRLGWPTQGRGGAEAHSCIVMPWPAIDWPGVQLSSEGNGQTCSCFAPRGPLGRRSVSTSLPATGNSTAAGPASCGTPAIAPSGYAESKETCTGRSRMAQTGVPRTPAISKGGCGGCGPGRRRRRRLLAGAVRPSDRRGRGMLAVSLAWRFVSFASCFVTPRIRLQAPRGG